MCDRSKPRKRMLQASEDKVFSDKRKMYGNVVWKAMAVGMLILLLSGCGRRKELSGIWYSGWDDNTILILKRDGSYQKGEETGESGEFKIEKDVLIFISREEPEVQRRFLISEEEGELVLTAEDEKDEREVYYRNQEAAQIACESRQEKQEKERLDAEFEILQTALEGYWYCKDAFPIEFTESGTLISYARGERREQTCRVVRGGSLSVTEKNGKVRQLSIKLWNRNSMKLESKNYYRAKALPLSSEALLGTWTNGSAETIFMKDRYIAHSAFQEETGERTVYFTITGDSTMDVPSQGGSQRAFLSETEKEYQLLLTTTREGKERLVFLTKKKL